MDTNDAKKAIEKIFSDTVFLGNVRDLIALRELADDLRKKVTPIHADALEKFALYAALSDGRRITVLDDCYLSDDEATYSSLIDFIDKKLRESGFLSADEEPGVCPYLRAKDNVRKQEDIILEPVCAILGVDFEKVYPPISNKLVNLIVEIYHHLFG